VAFARIASNCARREIPCLCRPPRFLECLSDDVEVRLHFLCEGFLKRMDLRALLLGERWRLFGARGRRVRPDPRLLRRRVHRPNVHPQIRERGIEAGKDRFCFVENGLHVGFRLSGVDGRACLGFDRLRESSVITKEPALSDRLPCCSVYHRALSASATRL